MRLRLVRPHSEYDRVVRCLRHRNRSNCRSRPTVTTPPTATNPDSPRRPKPSLTQRVIAFTFLGAFGLTMLTVLFTGLSVRSPSSRRAAAAPAVTLTVGEPRTINLVFDSRAALADVEFTVDLPSGIELADHVGERRIMGRAELTAGDNALPLTLIARDGRGGQLAARLRHGGDQKVFVVDLTVAEP